MYDIIICIHIWMCLYNCLCMYRYIYVVYIYIYIYLYTQTFYTGQQNGMFTRQLSSHAIYRLFFSNDPRHVSPTVCTRSSLDRTLDQRSSLVETLKASKAFSTTHICPYISRFFFDPITVHSLCCVFVPSYLPETTPRILT